MNSADDRPNPISPAPASADFDSTLRLVASLPAPEGLEDRVRTRLRTAPRSGRLLEWPAAARSTGVWMHSTAMRGVAAAAIVFVVAGGGWGIYTHVQPSRAIVMPARGGSGGGFSGANAMRTPQPFNAPKIDPAQAKPHPAIVPMPAPKHQPTSAKAGTDAHPHTVPAR